MGYKYLNNICKICQKKKPILHFKAEKNDKTSNTLFIHV